MRNGAKWENAKDALTLSLWHSLSLSVAMRVEDKKAAATLWPPHSVALSCRAATRSESFSQIIERYKRFLFYFSANFSLSLALSFCLFTLNRVFDVVYKGLTF